MAVIKNLIVLVIFEHSPSYYEIITAFTHL
ncbi:hypothetical protein ABID29_000959 [Streptococcus rupicaprae]|uniref:Uncharacterized protein n=1 Tax=Streptococcus rupicaprae TaxID=759619 RepID=A0ABV2FH27_9STRE